MRGIFGSDAVAFSQIHRGWDHLESAARVAQELVERFLEGRDIVIAYSLNVDPYADFKVATRLGRRHHPEPVIKEMSPRGFRFTGWGLLENQKTVEKERLLATQMNAVSVTPFQVDLTNYTQVAGVESWLTR